MHLPLAAGIFATMLLDLWQLSERRRGGYQSTAALLLSLLILNPAVQNA
ncbi:hypothetical protein [Thiorhodovibrio frisius]|nr:hypothetical protein [Thiorhodovibrio frisius]